MVFGAVDLEYHASVFMSLPPLVTAAQEDRNVFGVPGAACFCLSRPACPYIYLSQLPRLCRHDSLSRACRHRLCQWQQHLPVMRGCWHASAVHARGRYWAVQRHVVCGDISQL